MPIQTPEPVLIQQAKILLAAGLIVLRLNGVGAGRRLRWWNVIGISALLLWFSTILVLTAVGWLTIPA